MMKYKTNSENKNYVGTQKPANSEKNYENENTIWYGSATKEMRDLRVNELLTKLRAGQVVDETNLVYFPSVKTIDYKALKETNPTLYVKYYDEVRGCPTTAGWLQELRNLKDNTTNSHVDIALKIVKGTPQFRQLESLLKDLNRTEETLQYALGD